jgi:hypothetical protein
MFVDIVEGGCNAHILNEWDDMSFIVRFLIGRWVKPEYLHLDSSFVLDHDLTALL